MIHLIDTTPLAGPNLLATRALFQLGVELPCGRVVVVHNKDLPSHEKEADIG